MATPNSPKEISNMEHIGSPLAILNCLAGISIGLNTRNTLKLQYNSLGKPGISFLSRVAAASRLQMRSPRQLLAICAHLSAPRTTHHSQLCRLNAEWRSWCYGIKVRASTARKFSATTPTPTHGDSQVISPTTWNPFQNPYQGLSRGIAFLAQNLATGSRACSQTPRPIT